MRGWEVTERNLGMAVDYANGSNQVQIAEWHGITRQRVSHILKANFNMVELKALHKAARCRRIAMQHPRKCDFCGVTSGRPHGMSGEDWQRWRLHEECEDRWARAASVTGEADAHFWKRVDIRGRDDCWEWTGSKISNGYGRAGARGGKPLYAHRRAWELANGSLPDGMFVCHRCDNPPCVNPAHLFLGTPADNTRDAIAKGRFRFPGGGGRRKLTEAQAMEIRRRATAGESPRAIAADYPVSHSAVYAIRDGRTWKHLAATDRTG